MSHELRQPRRTGRIGQALEVPAREVHLFDSVAEGSVVISISCSSVVEVTCVPARWVPEDAGVPGQHLHRVDSSEAEVKTYKLSDLVRLIRPAPIAPCSECGFGRRDRSG